MLGHHLVRAARGGAHLRARVVNKTQTDRLDSAMRHARRVVLALLLAQSSAFRLVPHTVQRRRTQETSSALRRRAQAAPRQHAAGSVRMQLDHTFVTDLALGGVAGAISNVVIFPADLVKTKMQQAGDARACAVDTARAIVAAGGYRGLWAGSAPVLLGSAPESSIQLAVHAWLVAALLAAAGQHAEADLWWSEQLLAGCLAGASTVVATNPMEILRIKSSLSPDNSVLANIRALGLRGLYSGWDASWFRDIPFSAIYFTLYCQAKTALAPVLAGAHFDSLLCTLSGLAAGSVAAALTTPCDVVKTRVQTQALQLLSAPTAARRRVQEPRRSSSRAFIAAFESTNDLQIGVDADFEPGFESVGAGRARTKSVGETLRRIVDEEGWGALGTGLGPRVAKLAPGTAITMVIYENLHALLAAGQ